MEDLYNFPKRAVIKKFGGRKMPENLYVKVRFISLYVRIINVK